MPINREQAWQILCEWTETDSLRKHALAVETVMRAAAAKYGVPSDDAERWAIAGMLHDADYERWPEEHPKRIVAKLQEMGESDIAHAISAHYTKWDVPHQSGMDKALIACDELTGFIVACCKVRPDGIQSLNSDSVIKKLKTSSFAAKVERHEVNAGCEILGAELAPHIQFIIEALKSKAVELGIGGK